MGRMHGGCLIRMDASDPLRHIASRDTGGDGRLAPSPTGFLHLGNARSLLLAWLEMRLLNGRVQLRIEDLDQQRAVAGADDAIVRDLEWLGLDWDNELTPDYYQSNRGDLYRDAIARLNDKGLLYECFCSRKELRDVDPKRSLDGSLGA